MFLDSLRSWLINICTAVFFITAIEMILPDNSMKKYSKFVLGLILITVFINPIVNIFNKNFDITSYSNKIFENFDEKKNLDDLNKYKQKDIAETMNTFKLNLEKNCQQKLKQEYPDENYSVEANVGYDDKNGNVNINGIYVTEQKGIVNNIKKVTINTSDNSYQDTEELNDKRGEDIKSYLSNQLDVSENIVHVKKG